MQELPYGGWVAKNIYYMGYAGVLNVNGLRIGGVSGIFKNFDYPKGRFESPPYSEDTKRSVYHVRLFDVWRMKHLSGDMDICISHDWPRGIYHHGDTRDLIRSKPFFAGEIESNSLGSRPNEELLNHLKPKYWFSAHLHCKFAAVVEHKEGKTTKFLALDKCLPRRKFLQIYDIGEELKGEKPSLEHDLEWLTILHITNHLLSVKNSHHYLPTKTATDERGEFTPTEEEMAAVKTRLGGDLKVRETFERTAAAHNANKDKGRFYESPVEPVSNPQTQFLCDALNIDDPLQLVLAMAGRQFITYTAEEEEKTEGPPTAEEGAGGDDRDVVIEEEVTMERTRSSLSLPAPKNEKKEDDEEKQNPEEISVSDEEDDGDSGDVGGDLDKKEEEKDLPMGVIQDKVGELSTEESKPVAVAPAPVTTPSEPALPPVKKFKRRNESIYNANSDEDQ